jgi:hypothetical protein
MHLVLILVSILISPDSTPTCGPNPRRLALFDSAQTTHLAGHFHLTVVDTTGSTQADSGTDLVMWLNDSAHRYQYMERGIGIEHGERPFGGTFRRPGRPWIDPQATWEGLRYRAGTLYLGTTNVLDGGGTTFTISRLGPAGFSGRWTEDLGIAVITDRQTGRHLPNPAGYYCAWRVQPFPDAPRRAP